MSNALLTVKSYGRIHLMITPATSSDEYQVALVDAENPNSHILVGWVAREASALSDVISLLRSKVNDDHISQNLRRQIAVTTDAEEREHLEYHLRWNEWFGYQYATALQELETGEVVNRDGEV